LLSFSSDTNLKIIDFERYTPWVNLSGRSQEDGRGREREHGKGRIEKPKEA
jgi:hypothetical protein